MVRVPSTMLPLGTPAPDFSLPNIDGQVISKEAYAGGAPLLVMFICNHCPFVKHLREGLAQFGKDYQKSALKIVAISSNDIVAYPQDDLPAMTREAAEAGYVFPYLLDESQQVAKAYKAACTPDFFLFNASHHLVYRGQFDASRPGNEIPVTGGDLRAAVDAVLKGQTPAAEQTPSIGCNIKWKAGNNPDYFPG